MAGVAGVARLFVALEVAPTAVAELVRWREVVVVDRPGLRGALRFLPEASLHLTLCFLGGRPVEEVPRIGDACASLTASGTIPLVLGTPWWLPRRRPNVLAVGIDDDTGALRVMQGVLESRMRRSVGFTPERRMFIPHITVARVRRGEKVRPGAAVPPPSPVEFVGARVVLYESVLGDGPATYRALREVDLRG